MNEQQTSTARRSPRNRTFEGRTLPHQDAELVDQGFAFDLGTILDRRRALKLLGASALGVVAFGLAACGGSPAATSAATRAAATGAGSTGDCDVIPEETAGPFPGDGSNGPDVLSQSGVVRKDITTSFGELSGTAEGVPSRSSSTCRTPSNGCAPMAGAAIYVWHCDRGGNYSLYSPAAADQNYLRGVQEADSDGVVTFTSIFPACYPGRWPHIHFEVFPNLAAATDDANKIATSQIALPEDVCDTVYATVGLRAERPEPRPAQPGHGHGVRRRRRGPRARHGHRQRRTGLHGRPERSRQRLTSRRPAP